MSDEKREYDILCPLGWGNLRFVGTNGHCPVSGYNSCNGCDVNPKAPDFEKNRVKPVKK